jgi:uncharacterized Fe-S cluster-containing radical SAM superfamily protein
VPISTAHAIAPQHSPFSDPIIKPLDKAKFRHRAVTAKGERRATVTLRQLETVWINTGTLCNLACRGCYIESSPTNDALVYLTHAEVEPYLEEARKLGAREIGFTGGEPFMNRDIVAMIETALQSGFEVLVLTNAMRPMRRFESALLPLAKRRLTLRVSLDHYTRAVHEEERGVGSWDKALDGLKWLSGNGFTVAVAGRHLPGECDAHARDGYLQLFQSLDLDGDVSLILFPEMDATADVPEISEACWGVLGVSPSNMMCASSRMVVKARGAERPHVVACTLLPHDPQFALGPTLADARGSVALNHPHCARFCVLGGANCAG